MSRLGGRGAWRVGRPVGLRGQQLLRASLTAAIEEPVDVVEAVDLGDRADRALRRAPVGLAEVAEGVGPAADSASSSRGRAGPAARRPATARGRVDREVAPCRRGRATAARGRRAARAPRGRGPRREPRVVVRERPVRRPTLVVQRSRQRSPAAARSGRAPNSVRRPGLTMLPHVRPAQVSSRRSAEPAGSSDAQARLQAVELGPEHGGQVLAELLEPLGDLRDLGLPLLDVDRERLRRAAPRSCRGRRCRATPASARGRSGSRPPRPGRPCARRPTSAPGCSRRSPATGSRRPRRDGTS